MGLTREEKVIRDVVGKPTIQKFTPIATDMFLPNHSGDLSASKSKTLRAENYFGGTITLGAETLTNGTFTGSLAGWTDGYGTFSYSNNSAYYSGSNGNLWQQFNGKQAGLYYYSYTISNYTGNAIHKLATSVIATTASTGNGTFTGYFNHNIANTNLYFVTNTGTSTFNVDNISIKLVSSTTGNIISKNIYQDSYKVIDSSTIISQSVSYAISAGSAATATNADHAVTADSLTSSGFSVKEWSSYTPVSNSSTSGTELEFYQINLNSVGYYDVYDFEFTGTTISSIADTNFYLNFYETVYGSINHVLTFPVSIGSSGYGNRNWRIKGKIFSLSGDFQIVASLEFTDEDYYGVPNVILTKLGNSGAISTGSANNYFSLSVEDNSGTGYTTSTYGEVTKL